MKTMKVALSDSKVSREITRGIFARKISAHEWLRPLLLLTLLLCVIAARADAESEAVGHAYSVEDGRLLYTEIHRWDDQHHSVQYCYPDGELFATSELDFSHSFISPAYTQSYSQTGARQGARWEDDKLILFNGQREKSLGFDEPLVINAGFFHFIRAHWDELLAGKSVPFEFAVPDRLTIVALRIQHKSPTESAITDGDPQWIYFRVEAVSRMVRWLSTPLDVAFDTQRRLMVLRGTSTVKIDGGATPLVNIRYDYQSDEKPDDTTVPES